MAKRPHVDPVTAYATEVVSGRIVAGRLVRLACARHLTDIAEASARGLVWRHDEAQRVIDFFPEVLCLPDETEDGMGGKPFVLSPFQQFIAGSLFGWYTAAGFRRFRIAYIETAKGSGKTPFGAGLMLYLLVADGERGAQVYAAAVTKDQAKLAFTDAENMVKVSPELNALIDQKVNNLAVLDTGSYFRPISAEKRGLDGKRVHGALIDELHEHPSDIVTAKMRAGTKNRKNALIFEITNSGFDRHTVCYQHHEYSRQVLEGLASNDAWFAFVCHLDPCESCRAAGKLQPTDDCPHCDDWRTEGPHWLKANPNLGVSLSWQYLREQVREARGMPGHQNIVRRLNFCQWTEQATRWLDLAAWDACGEAPIDLAALAGRRCYLGLDLSSTRDLSALVLIFPSDDEESYQVLPFFWVPAESLTQRVARDHVPYDVWERDGYLETTDGNVIDYEVIRAKILTCVETFDVQEVAYDDWNATQLITQLTADGLACVPIRQGFKSLSAPSKEVEKLVLSKQLHHGGHPVLRWNAANVSAEQDAAGNIKPSKKASTERIDGIVALIMAVDRATRNANTGPHSWEEHGIPTTL